MATENLSPALSAPASSRPYPKAQRGYGKRSAPDQRRARADDFMVLPERERYIAGYVEHLPDGALMDIKTLAKGNPLYGQMAVAGALRALTVAGHLRRAQCRTGEGETRWVTVTYWSRTARDNEWWDTFAEAENLRVTQEAAAVAATPPPPWAVTEDPAEEVTAQAPVRAPEPDPAARSAVPQQRTTAEPAQDGPSPAYLALARLGRGEPRLALSAADCAVLEDLANAWLDRGVNTDYLTHALTSGLPDRVDSPVGFVRSRLTDRIPPHLPTSPAPATPGAPARRLLVECTECGTPGPSEALPDGLCRPCRTPAHGAAPAQPAEPPVERDIHTLVGTLRDLMKAP